jgi:hypothetical protein
MAASRSRGAVRWFKPRLEVLEDRAVPALVVTPLGGAVTPTTLVNSLLGNGVTASNITFTGAPVSAGTFTGGTGIVGIESGIVLSTGTAADIVGPNNSDSQTTDNGIPGDAQLTALSGVPTNDASILEFDFIPQGANLSFKYVFGSEEYNEFVNAGVNDVFAFFLNGQNVSVLPNSTIPVSIDTVNLTSNSQFYINNAGPTDPTPAAGPLLNTQMDGLTVVLTVTATVNPGVVNHIKLAIADGGDSILDSNVLIQSGSFAAPMAPILQAYRPLRYAFRSLEQNLGQQGPLPIGGSATTSSFDGLVTVVNVGNLAATGTVRVYFRDLPEGATVLNSTGLDPVLNEQFIDIPNVTLPADGTPLRIAVKISNPNLQSLGTFFVSPYELDVTTV